MGSAERQLVAAILSHKDELLHQVCSRLEKFSQSHYEVIPYESHLKREEALLAALLQGLTDDDPTIFISFVERVASQRSQEGYSLYEVQRALNIFEEELWRLLTTTQPVNSDMVAMLAVCNRLFGSAKDHLAKIYHQEKQQVQEELDDLRKKFAQFHNK